MTANLFLPTFARPEAMRGSSFGVRFSLLPYPPSTNPPPPPPTHRRLRSLRQGTANAPKLTTTFPPSSPRALRHRQVLLWHSPFVFLFSSVIPPEDFASVVLARRGRTPPIKLSSSMEAPLPTDRCLLHLSNLRTALKTPCSLPPTISSNTTFPPKPAPPRPPPPRLNSYLNYATDNRLANSRSPSPPGQSRNPFSPSEELYPPRSCRPSSGRFLSRHSALNGTGPGFQQLCPPRLSASSLPPDVAVLSPFRAHNLAAFAQNAALSFLSGISSGFFN